MSVWQHLLALESRFIVYSPNYIFSNQIHNYLTLIKLMNMSEYLWYISFKSICSHFINSFSLSFYIFYISTLRLSNKTLASVYIVLNLSSGINFLYFFNYSWVLDLILFNSSFLSLDSFLTFWTNFSLTYFPWLNWVSTNVLSTLLISSPSSHNLIDF